MCIHHAVAIWLRVPEDCGAEGMSQPGTSRVENVRKELRCGVELGRFTPFAPFATPEFSQEVQLQFCKHAAFRRLDSILGGSQQIASLAGWSRRPELRLCRISRNFVTIERKAKLTDGSDLLPRPHH
jgi:hypothetical protein